ncbi:MAG TPA: right-handed parallel beta-helix repeat-containing protein [Kofleriaceae bacterium]|nr:right-handed parallel beta-helix repeat-containing protein [Kofleriaceae bacterium]
MGESTIRVTASRAAELTGILRKRRSEPTTIVLEPGEYAIELAALIGPVTVVGEAGAARTLVRARPDEPMIKVSRDGSVATLRGLTLQGGESPAGGAIDANGETTVVVEDCVLQGNRALQLMGGAVYATSRVRLTMRRCLFFGNEAESGGAVAVRGDAVAVLEGCVFTRNRAVVGGGLMVGDQAQVSLSSCTFADNGASHPKGGQDLLVTGTRTTGPRAEVVNCLFASERSIVNNAERPGELILRRCAAMPGALDELRFAGDGNLAAPLMLVEVAPAMWALQPGSPASGTADVSRIAEGAIDLLGRPLVQGGRADPGALAAPAAGPGAG